MFLGAAVPKREQGATLQLHGVTLPSVLLYACVYEHMRLYYVSQNKIVFSDVCGPAPISLGCHRYYVTL